MNEQSPTFLAFAEKWPRALDAGLVAAAEILRDAVRDDLIDGYTTGKFTSGDAAKKVKTKAPKTGQDGNRYVAVGTDDFKQRIWEFGAFNAFTRQYERVEVYRMAAEKTGPQLAQVFHQEFNRVLNA
jgi:hypothetical protein